MDGAGSSQDLQPYTATPAAAAVSSVLVLQVDAPEDAPNPFSTLSVPPLEPQDTPESILEKAGEVRGFVCFSGRVAEEGAALRQWYEGGTPLVVVPAKKEYIETASVRKQQPLARLVDAGISVTHGLKALGRAFWHVGFAEFSSAATAARKLVEATGRTSYGERMEAATFDAYGDLNPVCPFREQTDTPEVIFTPFALGRCDPLKVQGIWPPAPGRQSVSLNERRELLKQGRKWASRAGFLEKVSEAVVRVFGYHASSSGGGGGGGGGGEEHQLEAPDPDPSVHYDVRSFTAFFVAPRLLLCTRTCAYNAERRSYAAEYMFTRRTRARHCMLRKGIDLFPCTQVKEVTGFLVDKIRSIGVELPPAAVPPDAMATPWNDVALLEVPEEHASDVYLLPSSRDLSTSSGDDVASLFYPEKPTASWKHEMQDSVDVAELFCGYDNKVVSLGATRESFEEGVAAHGCCLGPGARGSPVFADFEPVEVPGAADDDGDGPCLIYTFAGVNSGRSIASVEQASGENEASTSRASRSFHSFNCALSVRHITFILVYQEFVLPCFARKPEEAYLKSFLRPYDVFVQPDALSRCHRKMLKDAEDHNEWGMAFWERHDLSQALACFREGARMFCIATIPNMSPLEMKLKDALQSNVAAVVMSKLS